MYRDNSDCHSGQCHPMDRHNSEPLEHLAPRLTPTEFPIDFGAVVRIIQDYTHFKELLDEKDRLIAFWKAEAERRTL